MCVGVGEERRFDACTIHMAERECVCERSAVNAGNGDWFLFFFFARLGKNKIPENGGFFSGSSVFPRISLFSTKKHKKLKNKTKTHKTGRSQI